MKQSLCKNLLQFLNNELCYVWYALIIMEVGVVVRCDAAMQEFDKFVDYHSYEYLL